MPYCNCKYTGSLSIAKITVLLLSIECVCGARTSSRQLVGNIFRINYTSICNNTCWSLYSRLTAPYNSRHRGAMPQQHFRFEPRPNNFGNSVVSQEKLHEKVEPKTEKTGHMSYPRYICKIVAKETQICVLYLYVWKTRRPKRHQVSYTLSILKITTVSDRSNWTRSCRQRLERRANKRQ